MTPDYWFEDDDDGNDDDYDRWFEDDEPDLESMCIEPGCIADGSIGACGCCGGPLCHMHEEILCGFCTSCTSSSDFNERMMKQSGTSEQVSMQTVETLDDEIPF